MLPFKHVLAAISSDNIPGNEFVVTAQSQPAVIPLTSPVGHPPDDPSHLATPTRFYNATESMRERQREEEERQRQEEEFKEWKLHEKKRLERFQNLEAEIRSLSTEYDRVSAESEERTREIEALLDGTVILNRKKSITKCNIAT